MRDGLALHLNALLPAHHFLSVLDRLFDGGGNLVGLAVTAGDAAMLVADHHQRVETETPAALHDGGTTTNLDHALFHPVLTLFTISCHMVLHPRTANHPHARHRRVP